MSLKNNWVNKIDGVDFVNAEDVNIIAEAVIELEENGNNDNQNIGGYYTPNVSQKNENSMTVSFEASESSMPTIESKDIILPKGEKGNDGYTPVKGKDYFTEADEEEFMNRIDAVRKSEMFDTRQTVTPDYTNLIDIYGYHSGKHLNSAGTLIDNASTYVSGFIPVKLGDVIRIKDPGRATVNTTLSYAIYDANKTEVSGIAKTIGNIQTANNNDCGVLTIDGNVVTWTLDPINYYGWRNMAWMRVSAHSADMIVTINEPLTESVKEQLILKPTVKITKDSLEMELSDKPLHGKTVVGFGDSIFGYVRDSSSVLSRAAEVTGATIHNAGFGGCRMSSHTKDGYKSFSMYKLADAVATGVWTEQEMEAPLGQNYFAEQVALLKSIDFEKVDTVIIHYGSNDFTGGEGVAIDNPNNLYDCKTFIGAFRYSVERLLTAYPHLQIYVSLPTYCKYSSGGTYPETHTNALGKLQYEYIEALRNAATEYNLSVIDCFYGLGVNKFNVDTLTIDGAHHNEAGRKRLGEFIAGYLIGNQTSGKSGIDTDSVNTLINSAIGNAIGGSY